MAIVPNIVYGESVYTIHTIHRKTFFRNIDKKIWKILAIDKINKNKEIFNTIFRGCKESAKPELSP